jgi:N-glycosylase/DNA lyase
MNELARLKRDHAHLKRDVESRLAEFTMVWDSGTDETIFRELVFCLFTPQSKAKSCWAAVGRICDSDLLVRGPEEEIARNLKGVRFHRTKAARVVAARKHLRGLKTRFASFRSPVEARVWLVENIDGMSYKESSHFLRNIGMGGDLAILDRHILKNLVLLDVIPEIPKSISQKKYLEIEEEMRHFCSRAQIPMDHLDMVLWCRENGEIFK